MDVMVEADRQMCLRYYGADGGGESAALSLYPFTTEILTNMQVRAERTNTWVISNRNQDVALRC